MNKLKNFLISCYDFFSGEIAYKKYIEHQQQNHKNHLPMTKKDFLNKQRNKKWNGINRCC